MRNWSEAIRTKGITTGIFTCNVQFRKALALRGCETQRHLLLTLKQMISLEIQDDLLPGGLILLNCTLCTVFDILSSTLASGQTSWDLEFWEFRHI